MPLAFKRVPAIDKCFAILGLFAGSREPLGISDVANRLGINKSTVFNAIHTLADLHVLEADNGTKFRLGPHLYMLGHTAGRRSALIQTVHPFLDAINETTKLSAFLGIRSGTRAVILDKVDTAYDVKISSEVGMRLPLVAGAGGKALLAQLPNTEIHRILETSPLKKFTPTSTVDNAVFMREVEQVREQGIALDMEAYIEGIVALAVPIATHGRNLQAAVWAVGLRRQVTKKKLAAFTRYLKTVADQISQRFCTTTPSPDPRSGIGAG